VLLTPEPYVVLLDFGQSHPIGSRANRLNLFGYTRYQHRSLLVPPGADPNAQITTTPDNHALALVTAYILSGVIPFMWGPASKEMYYITDDDKASARISKLLHQGEIGLTMADLIPLPEFYKPNMDFVLHTLKESLFPANYSSVLLHSADTMFYRLQWWYMDREGKYPYRQELHNCNNRQVTDARGLVRTPQELQLAADAAAETYGLRAGGGPFAPAEQ
jgi:hypothetical protein